MLTLPAFTEGATITDPAPSRQQSLASRRSFAPDHGSLTVTPDLRISRPRIPLALAVPGTLVALAMLLPLTYLLLRAAGAGQEALSFLTSPRIAQLLWQTILLAGAVTLLAALLGVPLAWLTTRTDLPFRRFWSVLLVLPLAIPTYVGAFTLVAALGPRGLLQQALEGGFGIQRLPDIYGFGGATLALTLFTYPYILLTVRGAVLRLDPGFDQASRSLGAGPWITFLRVTIPLLRPSIAAGSLLVALYTLSDFGAVSLLQYDSFTRAIYLQYQGSLDRSIAAVLALVLVSLTGVILFAEAATRGRAKYYRSARSIESLPLYRLGRWVVPAVAFCAMTGLAALILPVAVLLYWFGRGLASSTVNFDSLWLPMISSASVSMLAAATALLAAIPVAILAVRHQGRFSATIERVAYASFALPGIVVALSLVFFGANFVPMLYQTLALLVFAYVVRFLPEAVGAVRSGLLQLNPRLEEVASGLGRRRHQVFLTITAPLIAPAALAGVTLVFMSAMKELPVTLLLSPIGFRTLATTTWNATAGGLYALAAPSALLLVILSAVFLPGLLTADRQAESEHVLDS
ncbi:MAG: iron ABC transporter permease [Chloroflexi bacterium]|nr:iron ABC transporter permease [Chloroflexota bacterium]